MSVDQESVFNLTEDDFDGSSPAPLLISGPERIDRLVNRQDAIANSLEIACFDQLDSIVKQDVIRFAANGIRNRMHQREGQNAMAYAKRSNVLPDYSLASHLSEGEIDEACEVSKNGGASLAQAALSALVYGMSSWEGKNLTIINTFRSDLEAPMWEEVSELTGVDARPKFDAMRKFKAHQFVGIGTKDDPIRAMRIEMKRTINKSDSGTHLKGRTLATINTANRPQLFRRYDLNTIYEASNAGEDLSKNQTFLDIAQRLVDNRLDEGVVLARNETVYGYNPEVEQAQNSRRLEVQKKELEDNPDEYFYNPHFEEMR